MSRKKRKNKRNKYARDKGLNASNSVSGQQVVSPDQPATATRPNWVEILTFWVLFATLAAAGAAAFFTWQLSQAAREQVRIAELTSRSELRAHVTVEPAGPPVLDDEGRVTSIPLRLVNSGKTPASDIARRIFGFIDYPVNRKNWKVRLTRKEAANRDLGVLPSGASLLRNAEIISTHPETGATERIVPDPDELVARGQHLYAAGQVFYRDVFGDDHWRTFCFFWTGDAVETASPEYCALDNESDLSVKSAD